MPSPSTARRACCRAPGRQPSEADRARPAARRVSATQPPRGTHASGGQIRAMAASLCLRRYRRSRRIPGRCCSGAASNLAGERTASRPRPPPSHRRSLPRRRSPRLVAVAVARPPVPGAALVLAAAPTGAVVAGTVPPRCPPSRTLRALPPPVPQSLEPRLRRRASATPGRVRRQRTSAPPLPLRPRGVVPGRTPETAVRFFGRKAGQTKGHGAPAVRVRFGGAPARIRGAALARPDRGGGCLCGRPVEHSRCRRAFSPYPSADGRAALCRTGGPGGPARGAVSSPRRDA